MFSNKINLLRIKKIDIINPFLTNKHIFPMEIKNI